jgi:hypothetical protein
VEVYVLTTTSTCTVHVVTDWCTLLQPSASIEPENFEFFLDARVCGGTFLAWSGLKREWSGVEGTLFV